MPFFLQAQITIEKKYEWVKDSMFWQSVKTISAVAGNTVANDTVMYIFSKVPEQLNSYVERLNVEYKHFDNYYYEMTTQVRVCVLRSRKIVVQRKVYRYTNKKVPNEPDDIIEKALFYAKEINLNNNNTFWNYPLIDEIINPIFLNDTIE